MDSPIDLDLAVVIGILCELMEEYDHNLEGNEQFIFADIVSRMKERLIRHPFKSPLNPIT